VTLTDQPFDLTPLEPPLERRRSRRRSWLVIALIVVAVGALLSQGLLHNLNYFETVDEAMHHRQMLGTTQFRLEGVVAPGTIQRTATGSTFFLNGTVSHEVFVVAHGQPPQLFRGDIPVVVDGHFTSSSSSVFDANQIIVKHTSDYVAQHPERVKAPNGSVR